MESFQFIPLLPVSMLLITICLAGLEVTLGYDMQVPSAWLSLLPGHKFPVHKQDPRSFGIWLTTLLRK